MRVVIVPVINGDGYHASREDPSFADASGDPGGAPSLAEAAARRRLARLPAQELRRASPDPATPCDSSRHRSQPQLRPAVGRPGSRSEPNSQTYRGTGPWSEPETQAVHEFSQMHDVTSLMTMHNFASLVLRPPGLHTAGPGARRGRA